MHAPQLSPSLLEWIVSRNITRIPFSAIQLKARKTLPRKKTIHKRILRTLAVKVGLYRTRHLSRPGAVGVAYIEKAAPT